jgi:hypothetical protein
MATRDAQVQSLDAGHIHSPPFGTDDSLAYHSAFACCHPAYMGCHTYKACITYLPLVFLDSHILRTAESLPMVNHTAGVSHLVYVQIVH